MKEREFSYWVQVQGEINQGAFRSQMLMELGPAPSRLGSRVWGLQNGSFPTETSLTCSALALRDLCHLMDASPALNCEKPSQYGHFLQIRT